MSLLRLAAGLGIVLAPLGQAENSDSPISISLFEHRNFAWLESTRQPGNHIFYRLHSLGPEIVGTVPSTAQDAGIDLEAAEHLEQAFAARPGKYIYRKTLTGAWAPQRWTFYLAPVSDGVEMLWIVETEATGLNKFYTARQFYDINRDMPETLDDKGLELWDIADQKLQKSKQTWVLREDKWDELPGGQGTVRATAPLGEAMGKLIQSKGQEVTAGGGIIKVQLEAPIDTGLVAMTNADRGWVSGLYWDRTARVENLGDHPTALVNLGPIPPEGSPVLR